jgi:hypothetical protein
VQSECVIYQSHFYRDAAPSGQGVIIHFRHLMRAVICLIGNRLERFAEAALRIHSTVHGLRACQLWLFAAEITFPTKSVSA